MKIQNRVEFQVVADLVLVFIINPLTKKHFGNDYAGKLQSETFPDNCLFPEQVSGSVPDICYGPRYIPRTVPDMFRAARNRDKTISDNCSVPELLPGTVFDICSASEMLTKKYSGICYEDKSLSETVGDWNSFARKVSGILYDNSLIREMIPHIVTVKDWITILSGDLFLARNRIAILLSGLFSAMNWII